MASTIHVWFNSYLAVSNTTLSSLLSSITASKITQPDTTTTHNYRHHQRCISSIRFVWFMFYDSNILNISSLTAAIVSILMKKTNKAKRFTCLIDKSSLVNTCNHRTSSSNRISTVISIYIHICIYVCIYMVHSISFQSF